MSYSAVNVSVRGIARCLLVAFAMALAPAAARAEEPSEIGSLFEKLVYQVPMRDGVKLYTVVYVPRDRTRTYPVLLNRTPYSVGPYGDGQYKASLGPSRFVQSAGYIFAYQDVRGRFMSEGDFVDVRPQLGPNAGPKAIDESTDTWDTIDFLVKNVPANSGRVGMYGISYPGFYTSAGVINAHPALKCASPQAPIADWFIYDDFHHNGAFFLSDAFRFYSVFGLPRPKPTTEWGPGFDFGTPDAYKFFLELGPLRNANEQHFKGNIAFWNDLMRHGTYDEFWKARSLPPHLKNVKPAILTVGGWFDAEDLSGALRTYDAIEKSSPGIHNSLVMGPWVHGGWARTKGDKLGDVSFGADTSEYYQREIELPFFNHYLKDAPAPNIPEAAVFATGRNEWLAFPSWPPPNVKTKPMFLGPNGRLIDTPPMQGDDFDEYVSDPSRPVPFTGFTAIRRSNEYMTEDQRFAARRPDVLTYSTELLTDDITIAGPIVVDLWVSTTGTDADFIVKLIDVMPDDTPNATENPCNVEMGGYQMLVRGEVMRGKFRDSFAKPEPFKPSEVTRVRFSLPDALHTFKKGHRMMIQIQSTWFPLVDRNPQTFCDIYNATEADFRKANHRVYRSARHGSNISFGILER